MMMERRTDSLRMLLQTDSTVIPCKTVSGIIKLLKVVKLTECILWHVSILEQKWQVENLTPPLF